MPVDKSIIVYVRCADFATAHELLWMACCCHLESSSLRCAMSPFDPLCSVDIELANSATLNRIRGMPGVLEANPCPAGLPNLHSPTEMWVELQQSLWIRDLNPHLSRLVEA